MKKTIRKSFSIVLTLIMIMAISVIAFAAINIEQAKAIALQNMELDESQVTFGECKLDDGKEFEIEFFFDGAEYDYSIDLNGTIQSFSYDANKQITGEKTISKEDAVSAALAFIGTDASEVKALYTEYDKDRYEGGEYTVNFILGTKEYEVTVSAVDGTVLEYDYEVMANGNTLLANFITFFRIISAFFRNLFVR